MVLFLYKFNILVGNEGNLHFAKELKKLSKMRASCWVFSNLSCDGKKPFNFSSSKGVGGFHLKQPMEFSSNFHYAHKFLHYKEVSVPTPLSSWSQSSYLREFCLWVSPFLLCFPAHHGQLHA